MTNFANAVITGNEWAYEHDPETKLQLSWRKTSDDPRGKEKKKEERKHSQFAATVKSRWASHLTTSVGTKALALHHDKLRHSMHLIPAFAKHNIPVVRQSHYPLTCLRVTSGYLPRWKYRQRNPIWMACDLWLLPKLNCLWKEIDFSDLAPRISRRLGWSPFQKTRFPGAFPIMVGGAGRNKPVHSQRYYFRRVWYLQIK